MKSQLKWFLVFNLVVCSFSKQVFVATDEWQTIQEGNSNYYLIKKGFN